MPIHQSVDWCKQRAVGAQPYLATLRLERARRSATRARSGFSSAREPLQGAGQEARRRHVGTAAEYASTLRRAWQLGLGRAPLDLRVSSYEHEARCWGGGYTPYYC